MTADITLKQCADGVRDRLSAHYPPGEAQALTRIVVEELLHYEPVDVVLHKDSIISPFMQEKIDKVVERLLNDEPVQYIFGKARFCGLEIKVTPDVLIPRPETQELVDCIVKEWGDRSDLSVLDVCTGSGCIAVALARGLKWTDVTAIDISEAALGVARDNVTQLKVNVTLRQGDALAMESPAEPLWDIIVSNPPYIAENEKRDMEQNVLRYEPHLALFVPDNDPLRFYKAIGRYAAASLRAGGELYFEINPLYRDALVAMLEGEGLVDVESWADAEGRQRFVRAKSPRDDG